MPTKTKTGMTATSGWGKRTCGSFAKGIWSVIVCELE